ncbi:hypothetical protein QT971_23445 [Microcoleus sp. herbarium19]|uniref:hypothetical protein n=1 Tax=unclassified Microcoleus TaxID=2642155 RepID=UPI002FCF9D8A
MIATPSTEPTLTDVIEKLDGLSSRVDTLSSRVDTLSSRVDNLATDVEKFNDRFSNYQQATQWVVQLAFTLIASATITVIVTSVLRR